MVYNIFLFVNFMVSLSRRQVSRIIKDYNSYCLDISELRMRNRDLSLLSKIINNFEIDNPRLIVRKILEDIPEMSYTQLNILEGLICNSYKDSIDYDSLNNAATFLGSEVSRRNVPKNLIGLLKKNNIDTDKEALEFYRKGEDGYSNVRSWVLENYLILRGLLPGRFKN